MRDHSKIIDDAGGTASLAQKIAPDLGGDPEIVRKRVWAWGAGGSIPGEYWTLLAAKGIATLEELAGAATARKLPDLNISEGAAA